jgi:hypothetical protein
MIRERVQAIRLRYALDNGPLEHMPPGIEPEQPSLFQIH